MKRALSIFVSILLLTATAASAQGRPGRAGGPHAGGPGGAMMGGRPLAGPGLGAHGPRFERNLFPPELVLRNQIAIGLTDDQTGQIKKLLTETHGRMVDVQVDLQRAVEKLNTTLDKPRVDEGAALAAAEQTMAIEARLKREHLGMLLRIKNILNEEQQAKLATMRGPRSGGADDPQP